MDLVWESDYVRKDGTFADSSFVQEEDFGLFLAEGQW